MTQDETIKQQDEIIGRLTRENENLLDSYRRRQEWIRKAKYDAGFDNMESFDDVWKVCLKAYLKIKQNENTSSKNTGAQETFSSDKV